MDNFRKNDIVVAVGSTVTKDGVTDLHRVLAKVRHVGKYDLFLVKINGSSYANTPFRMAKNSCVKVNDVATDPTCSIHLPKIGDLVLSFACYSSSDTQETKKGILTEVIRKPGLTTQAKILQGGKTEVVSYDSLIILEH